MPDEKKDFVIKDRRTMSEEKPAKAEKETEGAAEASQDRSDASSGAAESGAEGQTPLPAINFSTFIISLNASALVHLGQLEDPATGTKTKNLPMAKQTIDILSMLEEKSSGNLTSDEENILKSILYDLRINYVKLSS